MNNKIFRWPAIIFLSVFLLGSYICSAQSKIDKEEYVNKYSPIDLKKDGWFVNYYNRFKLLVKNSDAVGLSKLSENSYPFPVLLDNPAKEKD